MSDAEQTDQSGIPASLGSAAEELRSNVERQVREIVAAADQRAQEAIEAGDRRARQTIEAAERRAEEIEAAALRRAREKEASAERQARRVFVDAQQRASSFLASLDVLETRIGSAIADMRRAGEGLANEIRRATPEPGPELSDPELRDQLLSPPTQEPAAAGEQPAAAPEASVPPPPAAGNAPASAEMVREQLQKLRAEGRTRQQAARSLLEHSKDGGEYRAILDEVFPEEPEAGEKRGLLRRRRARRPDAVEER